MTGGGEAHADDAQRHTTHRALEGDDAHAAADMHELVTLLEEIIHDHDTRRFRGHVAVLSNCHTDRGGHHGRGVIDAIAPKSSPAYLVRSPSSIFSAIKFIAPAHSTSG